MIRSLTLTPLRLGVRTARTGLRATRDLADLGLAALELAARALGEREPAAPGERAEAARMEQASEHNGGRTTPRPPRPAAPPVAPAPGPPIRPAAPVAPADPPPPSPPSLSVVDDGPPAPAPEHVDEEAELVEAQADPGAEDGAGASLRVAPPFAGYDALRAPDVIARLPGADLAELGETELYERTHRARRTVLDAIAREIRRRP